MTRLDKALCLIYNRQAMKEALETPPLLTDAPGQIITYSVVPEVEWNRKRYAPFRTPPSPVHVSATATALSALASTPQP